MTDKNNKKPLICAECDACKKGFFKAQPDAFVCIGTKVPFVVDYIFAPCIAYPGKLNEQKPKSEFDAVDKFRPTKDNYYLDIALAVLKRSTCLKRHYGCVIVNNDIIIATGYNGSPRGEENCCDRGTCMRADAKRYSGYEACCSVHAEQNALIAASYDKLQNATVYLACEEFGKNELRSVVYGETIMEWQEDKNPVPCPLCMRMLKNAGIKRIVNRKGDVYVRY